MEKLNILIVSKIGFYTGYLDDIAALDARISVKDASPLFVAELRRNGFASPWLNIMAADMALQPEQKTNMSGEDFDDLLAQAEVIYATVLLPDDLLRRAPRLKWIHFGSAGLDAYAGKGLKEAKLLLTNSRGALATGMAEHILASSFALARDFPRLMANKQGRRWDRYTVTELNGKVMGIIGLGAIGGEAARLAKAVGMKVVAIKRTAAKHEKDVLGIDELFPSAELHRMLPLCDFVAITAPLTPETKGMLGERELNVMKPSAFLINVARGQIVDQRALIKALKEGRIAGAGLDVFEAEPLPADSELWGLPNVILSPHMAGWTDLRSRRVVGLFCENIQRYLAGKPLLNVLDFKRGY